MRSTFSILTTFLLTMLIPFGQAVASQAEEITAEQLLASPGNYFILDVRTAGEYQEGHIPGAILLPLDKVQKQSNLATRFKDKKAIVYCRTGRRAGIAIQILKQMGVKQLAGLKGDMIDWMANNRPVHQGIMP